MPLSITSQTMVSGLLEHLNSGTVPAQTPLPSCHTTQVYSGFATCSVTRLRGVAAALIVVIFGGFFVGFAGGRLADFVPVPFAGFVTGFLATLLGGFFVAIVPPP